MGSYDQVGINVGNAMMEYGFQKLRDKRDDKRYSEELRRKEAEDEKRYQMELERIEKSELAKAEREAAREQARAERDAIADARKHQYAMELEDKRGASREKAASIRSNRPVMAREPREPAPKYDRTRNAKTGVQGYHKVGEPLAPDEEFYVPRGDRRDRRPVMADMGAVAGPLAKMAGTFAGGSPGPAAPKAAGPKPGDVIDGYQYVGGDPADQNSWKRI